MRDVDPATQCEIIKRPRMGLMAMHFMMYAGMTQMINESLYGKPKYPHPDTHAPWYRENLTKEERKLPAEDRGELRRYKWTLRKMKERDY